MDGMTLQALPEVARQHGERLRAALEAGTDRPAAVLRVMLPNAARGERPLGRPPVLDRVMQHAIAQGIGPRVAPHFSTDRSGLRPGRRARMALAERAEAHRAGRRYGVACARKRVVAPGHHRLVRHRRATPRRDRRVWRLLGRSRRAGGILPEGRRAPTAGGMPPGGPLAPWLATGRLDELDKAWARRGLRGARDADDVLSVVRAPRAATRGLPRISRGSAGPWRRRGTPHKRQAARLSAGSCLGFALRRATWQWTDAAVQRVQERGREMTDRRNGRPITARLEALTREGAGGRNDFGHRQREAEVVAVDPWLRRRVRLCYGQPWPRPRTRRRHLLALGITRDAVKRATRRRTGHWRLAGHRSVPRALTTPWW